MSSGLGDVYIRIAPFIASDRQLHRLAADLAVLNHRTSDVGLDGEIEDLATPWAGDLEVVHGVIVERWARESDAPAGEVPAEPESGH